MTTIMTPTPDRTVTARDFDRLNADYDELRRVCMSEIKQLKEHLGEALVRENNLIARAEKAEAEIKRLMRE